MHAISNQYEPNPKAELGANLEEAADMKEEDLKQYILSPTGSRTHPASDDIFFASYIQIWFVGRFEDYSCYIFDQVAYE